MLPNYKFFESRIGGSFHYQNKWMDLYADQIRNKVFFDNIQVTGKRILDIGCGGGQWGSKFFRRGAVGVMGVEQTKKLADNCIHLCTYPDLKKLVSLKSSHVNYEFDLVTGFTSFQFMLPNKRRKILKDISKILNKNGQLCILDYLPDRVPDYQKNLDYKEVWSLDRWFFELTETGFKIEDMVNINWVDTTLFHYFGSNIVTYFLTYLLDRCFMFEPKYRLLILTKK